MKTLKTETKIILGIVVLFLMHGMPHAQSTINLANENQIITGFGGMLFPRWGRDLSEAQVNTAFGNGTGQIGMTLMRLDVAPNSNEWNKVVHAAKQAKGMGAKLFGSPWSPPASMKNNNNLIDGALNTNSYAAYAKHLSDFVGFMKTNGAELEAISIQNEPDIEVSYESCRWSSSQLQTFLKNNAGTIPTRIIAAESFNFNKSMTDPLLNDAAAAANFEIVGVHLYGTKPSSYPLARTKGKELWMTEHITTTNDGNIWKEALDVGIEIQSCLNNNFNAYTWWYIRRNYGLINDDGVVTKRGYVMSQFTKFVRPGFVRVDAPASPASGVSATAYKRGGDVVMVLINSNTSVKSQGFTLANATTPVSAFRKYTTSSSKNVADDGSVGVTNNAFTVSLDAQSITTLVYKAPTSVERDPIRGEASRATAGEYLVFDASGTRLGRVTVEEGRSIREEARAVATRPGLVFAMPVQGDQVISIHVTLR